MTCETNFLPNSFTGMNLHTWPSINKSWNIQSFRKIPGREELPCLLLFIPPLTPSPSLFFPQQWSALVCFCNFFGSFIPFFSFWFCFCLYFPFCTQNNLFSYHLKGCSCHYADYWIGVYHIAHYTIILYLTVFDKISSLSCHNLATSDYNSSLSSSLEAPAHCAENQAPISTTMANRRHHKSQKP